APAVESPLPELVRGALRLATGTEPWLPRAGHRRVGAVTACSDSGAVYHVLLEGPESLDAVAVPGSRGGGFPRLGIVGVGARLPDAPDARAFWSNVLVGHGSIREVPPERFDARRYLDAEGSGTRVYSTLGATLPRPPRDGARQGLSPAALAQVDAAWLPAVDAALEAWADAGPELAGTPPERVAVVLASAPQREREYEVAARVALARVLESLGRALEAGGVPAGARGAYEEAVRARLLALYPSITEDTLGGCGGAALAAQVARRVGARAAAFTVESACASSLAVLTVAARGLERGAYDVALVGGVGDALSPEMLLSFCAFRGLSAEGLFPFDERASGFVLGEGAAFLVLRRAADVEARGGRAYAALVGCGGTSDGQGRSAFSPDPVAQAACCTRALEQAGVSPSEVDYIECHGTGTPVGDVSEVKAYGLAYGGRARSRPLVLASAKSMVGHLNAGAGSVGLVRAALSLHHGWLPPTPGVTRVSAELPLADGPFEVGRVLTPWTRREDGGPRRAGVSGFGLGGTSFHAVLEEWPGAPREQPGEPLSPEVSPMLDERRREPGGGMSFRRRLSLGRELFLREHIVGGRPALPGAFGCELMAQAAALALPGLRPVGLADVRFERLLEVPEDAAVDARVHVSAPRPSAPGRVVVDVTVSADFRLPAFPDRVVPRRHYQGRVELAREPAPRVQVAAEVLAASRAPGRDYQTIYSDHSYCHLGPLFQAIRTSTVLGRERLLARIDVPAESGLYAGCPAPRFWLGPTLFDNYLQVAGTVGVYHNHCFPMPQGLRQVELWERGQPGQSVWAHATLLRDTGGELLHRIEVFNAEGWLLCRCEDFATRTSQPFSASELVTFYQGLTGGPPEYRPPASEAGNWEMSV
ncbi:MAG TPA: beta-ketoacyl synthase N-terminal-like domain-containing protein, partial [Myxococcus sp.]|nr:beta-ketoacyl synthase N-terminal-like domain-containing protein [Myxococcus sp.]